MKKSKFIVFVVFIFLTVEGFPQNINREFGAVTISDFKVEAPDYDTNAVAVILFDIGSARFFDSDEGLDIRFTRNKRIRILKEAGLEYAEIKIPLYFSSYAKRETLYDIKVNSFSLSNGMIQKKSLGKESVYEEKISEHTILKKIAVPAVKVGTVIDIQYIMVSPYVVNLPDWEFQNEIPTLYSKYEVGITPFYEYTFLLQGADKFDEYKKSDEYWKKKSFDLVEYHDLVHEFVMKDIPAFKDEAYITSREDYLIKLDFQLSKINYTSGGVRQFLKTWSSLNKEFLQNDDFGDFTKKSERVARKIIDEELSINGLSQSEKFTSIVDYVKNRFSWDGKYRKFTDKSVNKFLKESTGSSAELNLFLAGMLNAAGIKANPVLISTRDHGRIYLKYPYAHLFNDVIVLANVDGRNVLTDATEPLLASDRIPSECINHYGLVIDKEGESWIDLSNSYNFTSATSKTLAIKIDTANNMINATVRERCDEYAAIGKKKMFVEDEENYVRKLEKRGLENVSILEVKNDNRPGQPFIVKYSVDFPLGFIDDKILISPFLTLPMSENLLKQKERNFPVDMIYRKHWSYTSSIELPVGYEVVEMPEAYLMDNSIAKIVIVTENKNNVLFVRGVVELKKAVYPLEEYKRLRSYLNEIVRRLNDRVVIQKAEPENG